MKKLICSILCALLIATCMVTVSQASGSNVIFSSFTDEKIGTITWVNSQNVEYEDGILTINTAGENTKANVYLNGTNLKNTDLASGITAGTAKFTLHTEVRIPAYTTSTIIEAGIVLGNTVNPDTSVNTRFFLMDTGSQRNTVPRDVHVRLQNNVAGANNFVSDAVSANIDFVANAWMSLDVLVDMSQGTAAMYVNNALITTFACTKTRMDAAGYKVGFRGYEGVSFRNFSVYNGLVVPQIQTPSATPTPTATATPHVTPTPTASATASAGTSAKPTITVAPESTSPATTPNATLPTATTDGTTATGGNGNPITSDRNYMPIILGAVVLLAAVALFIILRCKRVCRRGE